MTEKCTICGCELHRTKNAYARPSVEGRSHATAHHYVAERFFGRSSNRRGTVRESIFSACPWGSEGKSAVFCYECHEELLHNPVILADDLKKFSELVRLKGFSESIKTESRDPLAGRIKLLQAAISRGISELFNEEKKNGS